MELTVYLHHGQRGGKDEGSEDEPVISSKRRLSLPACKKSEANTSYSQQLKDDAGGNDAFGVVVGHLELRRVFA